MVYEWVTPTPDLPVTLGVMWIDVDGGHAVRRGSFTQHYGMDVFRIEILDADVMLHVCADLAHEIAEALERANPAGRVLGEEERQVIRNVVNRHRND